MGIVFILLGIGFGIYFQCWIISLIINAFTGGGGGGHTNPKTLIVHSMPARRPLQRAYSMIRSFA